MTNKNMKDNKIDRQETRRENGTRFSVKGMTCANCAGNVERALGKVEGVTFAAVNLATETAFVKAGPGVEREQLERAVAGAGYKVSYERVEDLDRKRYEAAKRELILGWVVTLPLMVLMAVHMAGVHIAGFTWMELLGAGFVILTAGRRTLKGAWTAAIHGHSNMDTLIVAGATASWATAALHLAGVAIHSFGAIGAMIVTLHVTGRFIESRLRDRASKATKALLSIQAEEARVVAETDEEKVKRGGDAEMKIPIDAVKKGFVLRVLPGERIPADGVVTRGGSSVDESVITGEAVPVKKNVNDNVTGGSMNLTGTMDIRVTRVGDDAFLSKMIRLVEEAQGTKVPIQALADKITKYFVPGIIVAALLSGVVWYLAVDHLSGLLTWAGRYIPWVLDSRAPLTVGVFAFVSTLVIACPCALGLATPMALIAGTGKASRAGLIIRNAEAISTAKDVRTVVLDKTGTLTEGRPRVVKHNLDEETARVAAAAELQSNHPLAKAVSAMFEDQPETGDYMEIDPAEITGLEERAGEGLFFKWREEDFFIGKPEDSDAGVYRTHLELGRTVVEVRRNNGLAGFIAIEDPIRKDSAAAVENLKSLNIRPVMATGDNDITARAVAKKAGIERVHAGLRPEEKLELVRRYGAEGKVLMVGDGMNDAAAIKGADIGVAVGTGADLALDSADIIIVKGGIPKVYEAIRISRKTYKVIKQNLFWAFAYNLIAIPLAMSALLHPVVAEAAMAFSSISVVANSGRIASKNGKGV